MIKLHGFEPTFGIIEPSPFVLKVHTFLRMSNIEYQTNTNANNLKNAPKGKLPFITDDGKIIADSQFILEHIRKKYGDHLDKQLLPEQKSKAYLLTKSLDENLYFCLVYSRWIKDDTWPIIKKAFFFGLPPIMRSVIAAMVQRSMKAKLKQQGLTVHSDQEILHIAQLSFEALSNILGQQKFMFGDKPCSFDAACYAMLVQFIEVNIDNLFNQQARKYTNLVDYCQRITTTYF